MKKKVTCILMIAVTVVTVMAGCHQDAEENLRKNLKPGTYTGQSQTASEEDGGGYAVVKLTVGNDNNIESIIFDTYDKNGKKRFSDNGSVNVPQYATDEEAELLGDIGEACMLYKEQFIETKDAEQLDAVSGATLSYEQFKEAVDIALQKASE